MTAEPRALTDAELVGRCRDGDEGAWSEFVDRFSRYVYAIVRAHRLGNADGEDVFQEAFARAFERLDELRDAAAVRAWMGQLTRRLAIDRLRRTSGEQLTDEPPEAAVSDPALDQVEEAMTVRDAMARLSADCQEIIDRFFARDESYRTIGDALDIPPGTIASRISRCLAKLREDLAGRSEPLQASDR
jgi:RNA polymerase sigma factor (sigma-70 family)